MIYQKVRGRYRRFRLWKRFHRYETDLERRLTNLDNSVQLEIYELLRERSAKATGDDGKRRWKLIYLEEDAGRAVNEFTLRSRLPHSKTTEYRVILCGRDLNEEGLESLNRGTSDGLV